MFNFNVLISPYQQLVTHMKQPQQLEYFIHFIQSTQLLLEKQALSKNK